jgi:hypothetical protein
LRRFRSRNEQGGGLEVAVRRLWRQYWNLKDTGVSMKHNVGYYQVLESLSNSPFYRGRQIKSVHWSHMSTRIDCAAMNTPLAMKNILIDVIAKQMVMSIG